MAMMYTGWWDRRSSDEKVTLVGCMFFCMIVTIALFILYNPPQPDPNTIVCHVVMAGKDGGEYVRQVYIPIGSSCADHVMRAAAVQ